MKIKIVLSTGLVLVLSVCSLAQNAPGNRTPFLVNGKFPKDLAINIVSKSGGPSDFVTTYTVLADGKVYVEQTSAYDVVDCDPLGLSAGGDDKKPTNKLSKKQVIDLIIEIEKSGFFDMRESYPGPDPTGAGHLTFGRTRSIEILGKRMGKRVLFDLDFQYRDEDQSHFKQFQALYGKILSVISGVKDNRSAGLRFR